MIRSLDKKFFRDAWSIKGQLLAIILVMGSGIAVFILMFGVMDSLKLTRDTYYDRYHFAEIFASLKRAPESVLQRIKEIDGVTLAESRVKFGTTIQMDTMPEPISGTIISYSNQNTPLLNQLYLRSGRMLFPNEDSSLLVDESFYQAHKLNLGDKLTLIINGYKRQFSIAGVVLSPEYVYTIAPGALMPDGKRYGIFWMNRRSLEAMVGMKGAFNELSVKCHRNASIEKIKTQIDHILKPYGGLIAYARDEQISNFFLSNELKQLDSMSLFAPFVFLSIAAFLINVVMSRLIATQREQIGMLKAVGFTHTEITRHYLRTAFFITIASGVFGVALGSWMGVGMTKIYAEFFHFPILKYHFSFEVIIFAMMCCSLAAILGAAHAIRVAILLPPAESMRPASPPVFKKSRLDQIGLYQNLHFLSRIVIRQIERRPVRALLSTLGMAMALSLLIFTFFMQDSISYLIDTQYNITQREDVNVTFNNAKPYHAIEELKTFPGVLRVEPIRDVAVNLIFSNRSKKTLITGLSRNAELRRIIDENLMPVPIPETGVVISQKLAQILHVDVGHRLTVEVLEEKRQTLSIPIVAITPELMGTGLYMNIQQLNNILDSEPKVSGALMMIDHDQSSVLYNRLKQIPSIMGLNIVAILRDLFKETMAENLLRMVSSNILFASVISFGVIYNTARIALSERSRELASLRVLGLTRTEVAYLLFGELSLITLFSIPIGIVIGRYLSYLITLSMESELFRIPLIINNNTYGYSVITVLACAVVSFYLVWRQVDKIDLVSAQKGVE